MTYLLSVNYRNVPLITCPVNTVYGRTLVLFGLVFPEHLQERPQDAPVALGRLVRTIEDALQENLDAHYRWMALCDSQTREPVAVDIVSRSEKVKTVADNWRGGDGGDGAWPAGGGGGGGAAILGSNGGNGADGAALLFEYGPDGHLIDIEAFVLPSTCNWMPPPGVATVKYVLFGGGGGGAGCAPNGGSDSAPRMQWHRQV